MQYYPKSRIITNQTANPGQFILPDGTSYSGPYYVTFDSKFFTGSSPNSINSKPLIPLNNSKSKKINGISPNANVYNKLNSSIDVDLIDPTPFTPKPTEEDYKIGRITRYVARQKGGTQFRVMEIDKTTYDNLTQQRGDVNYSVWRAISIQWLISGPLHDELVNGIRVRPGIIDTNQKILDQAEKNFIGIKQYLSDLTQFAR